MGQRELSGRLWRMFSELARSYQKVECRRRGLYLAVHVENKGRSALVSEFEQGWFVELTKDSGTAVGERIVKSAKEAVTAVREWLDT
jgi:hypothetical protein